jgi:hypothetical protein
LVVLFRTERRQNMNRYLVRVLFFTGFNHFYDKIIAKEIIKAVNEEEAKEIIKNKYPCVTNDIVLNCGIECVINKKWKEELKYEVCQQ